MPLIAEEHGVSFALLTYEQLDECVDIMTEIFAKNEPLTRLLDITAQEFAYFAEIFAEKAVREELAVCARDSDSGRMEGFCLSEDLITDPPDGIEGISPKFQPIFGLIEALDGWFLQKRDVYPGQYLHIFMTGIARTCRNRAVSTGVVRESLLLARERGYIGALGESTHTLAIRAARRNHFRELHAIDYESFTFDGSAVFRGMGPRAKCALMYRSLEGPYPEF